MLELLEQQKRLTTNQKKIVAAAVIGDMLDYFDFGLIGFALAFIVGPWKLTYGQSAMILLTSGIGGVPGALIYGWLADRIGRRTVFIITALNFSLATGVMALTPDYGGWIFLSVCRFSVLASRPVYRRLAIGAGIRADSEARLIGGLVTSLLPIAGIMGAALGAFATPIIGWRGLFAIGPDRESEAADSRPRLTLVRYRVHILRHC
jgi:putative MFS transporter